MHRLTDPLRHCRQHHHHHLDQLLMLLLAAVLQPEECLVFSPHLLANQLDPLLRLREVSDIHHHHLLQLLVLIDRRVRPDHLSQELHPAR